jgi:hypothetical protein
MVEHIRPSGNVSAVFTPTKPRPVKRDRNRQDPREQQAEDEGAGRQAENPDEPPPTEPGTKKNQSGTGKRIDVVV